MSAHSPKTPYRDLVGAARRATTGPSDGQINAVFRRLAEEVETPSPARWLTAWSLAGAAVIIAGLVTVALWPRSEVEPVQIAMLGGPSQLRAADGRPLLLTDPMPQGATLDLGENGRARLEVGDVASVIVQGPARIVNTRGKNVTLTSGRAAFSVKRRPPGTEFAVQAGDSRVAVHGTRFELAVENGVLRGLQVTEGVVELQRPKSAGLRLTAGQQWGEALPPSQVSEAAVAARDAHSGYLEIRTHPEGAQVELDGVEWGAAPVLVRVASGSHVAKASLQGRVDGHGQVVSRAGEVVSLDLRLEPEPEMPVDEAELDEEPVPPVGHSNKLPSKLSVMNAAARALKAGRCQELEKIAQTIATSDEAKRLRVEALMAECQLRAGRKEEALKLYARIAVSNSAGAEAAQFETVKLLGELKRKPEAFEALEAYLTRYPQGRYAVEAEFRRCESLIDAKRLSDARACLEQFSMRHGHTARGPDAVFLLATLARIERRWVDAVEAYERYLSAREAPRAEEALYQQINCLERGALPGVAAAARRYLTQFPSGRHIDDLKRRNLAP